jgi:hypothetical protein
VATVVVYLKDGNRCTFQAFFLLRQNTLQEWQATRAFVGQPHIHYKENIVAIIAIPNGQKKVLLKAGLTPLPHVVMEVCEPFELALNHLTIGK